MKAGKKVLLTGGAGFIGGHIADELSDRGFDVTVFDIKPSPWVKKNQKMICGDILNYDFLQELMKGHDYVYHLAGLADLNIAKSRPLETVKANIEGTVNLLQAAVENKVKRFLFASTVYVYSREGGFYRCSKQACESYIEEFSKQFDLKYTILRYGSLYGPRANESNGLYRLLKQAMETGVVEYKGTKHDKREYIHVQDAAKLSVDALSPDFENTHVVLTGNDRFEMEEMFRVFSEILGRQIEVKYIDAGKNGGHYSISPYAFTPKVGKKITSPIYTDMGQGIIQVMEEIHHKITDK